MHFYKKVTETSEKMKKMMMMMMITYRTREKVKFSTLSGWEMNNPIFFIL